MQWFGEPYPSREHPAPLFILGDDEVPTPLGMSCLYCDEPILMGERGFVMPLVTGTNAVIARAAQHYECFIRQMLGSVAHRAGRCTCYGGTESDDDGDVTPRRSALLAFAEYERRGGG